MRLRQAKMKLSLPKGQCRGRLSGDGYSIICQAKGYGALTVGEASNICYHKCTNVVSAIGSDVFGLRPAKPKVNGIRDVK